MNWSRSSSAAILVALLLVAVAPAAAVSVSGDAPGTVEIGEKQTTTYTVVDPFDGYGQWTLRGSTDLTDVTWQITTYDNTDNQVDETIINGQSFSYDLAADSGAVRAEVRLVGTPASGVDWQYDPPQQITYAEFVQAQEGGSSENMSRDMARPFTPESQSARTAIEDAEAAIADAEDDGVDVSSAQGDLEDAIEFYNNGNFEQATKNAEEAQSTAEDAMQSKQQTNRLMLIGGAIVVLLLVAGGIYWYLQQRESYDRLG
ncbi:flagellar basal body-associated FliL family protein [Halanaeroarchaeum sulfurireducens]|uniref:Uncharacterized protein n=1 Tax=Halanaeroarchaeum sulfurireducens TaxID=1604004 RepID=A0A0F7PCJ5_9EURY|nr:hypothetical protein [Halanaeroarchaeum sulfurireducens]AKH98417.1 hypothetical protein HLASF_1948 [Halanaeroarchaeum sulfurireducens]